MRLLSATTAAPAQGSDPIDGQVSVIDGDTIDGQRIRLSGIDAPEVDQRCNRELPSSVSIEGHETSDGSQSLRRSFRSHSLF